jgi:outer membrane biosynthesis protein TonB
MNATPIPCRSRLVFSILLCAAILALPGGPAVAAPLPGAQPKVVSGHAVFHVAQAAAGAREAVRAPTKPGINAGSASSKQVRVNVFMLSDQPNNPDEVLESRGSRYTYFSSRRLVSPARPLAELKPRYPAGKLAEQDGAVLLQLLINERGGLDYVDVLCAAPAFEQSVRDSLRGMKFAPAQGRDGPVKSYMWVEFSYGRGFPCPGVPD